MFDQGSIDILVGMWALSNEVIAIIDMFKADKILSQVDSLDISNMNTLVLLQKF
jgi:hypothetical protein